MFFSISDLLKSQQNSFINKGKLEKEIQSDRNIAKACEKIDQNTIFILLFQSPQRIEFSRFKSKPIKFDTGEREPHFLLGLQPEPKLKQAIAKPVLERYFKPGIGKLRPACQMRPANKFIVALERPHFKCIKEKLLIN